MIVKLLLDQRSSALECTELDKTIDALKKLLDKAAPEANEKVVDKSVRATFTKLLGLEASMRQFTWSLCCSPPAMQMPAGGVFEEAIYMASMLLEPECRITQTVRNADIIDNTFRVGL